MSPRKRSRRITEPTPRAQYTPRELERLYAQGTNISALLRAEERDGEREAIIETSYDLQAGSYIATMERAPVRSDKEAFTHDVARVIEELGHFEQVLEAGVGEATTLAGVLKHLQRPELDAYGFDLSWSRVAYARQWLEEQSIHGTTLCTGSLLHIPLASNSVDLVYTSHSIEPNSGNEEPILRELFRVAREYVVLLEPGYEFASPKARARMESHGYCTNLRGVAQSLGIEILRHELFSQIGSPLNPTAITVLRKATDAARPAHVLACPRHATPLVELGGAYFSPEALAVYPILASIPCLRVENSIAASKFPEFAVSATPPEPIHVSNRP